MYVIFVRETTRGQSVEMLRESPKWVTFRADNEALKSIVDALSSTKDKGQPGQLWTTRLIEHSVINGAVRISVNTVGQGGGSAPTGHSRLLSEIDPSLRQNTLDAFFRALDIYSTALTISLSEAGCTAVVTVPDGAVAQLVGCSGV